MSDALNSSSRRLKLVTLLQSKRYITVNEIAEEFAISRRTVFRDINVLGEMGIPILSDRDRGYSMDRNYTVPPMMFTEKELSTLMVGLGYLKGQVDRGLSQSARDVEVKIQGILPTKLQDFMRTISNKVVLYPYYHEEIWEKSDENWYEILSAINERKSITCTYHSLKQGTISERRIDPYLLVYYTDHWDLIGFCHSSNSLRTFVLKRMSGLMVDPNSYFVRDGLSDEQIIHRQNENNRVIRILVDALVADVLTKSLPAVIKSLATVGEQTEVTFEFDNLRWINQWLLQFGKSITILEPAEMIDDRTSLLMDLLS
jgi:predicted DNA-binding transcriptional regulator YafY